MACLMLWSPLRPPQLGSPASSAIKTWQTIIRFHPSRKETSHYTASVWNKRAAHGSYLAAKERDE